MKPVIIFALSTLAGVFAAPSGELVERQLLGDTANEFLQGGCKKVVMVYARASTETGNIGISCGPVLHNGLNLRYRGNFAMQGVKYPADLVSNFLPEGTLSSAYSQGTAVTAGAVSRLPSNIRDRVGAAVLFGYTKNLQNKGGIPGFPQDRLKVYCAIGDLVCTGTLIITAAHFGYMLLDAQTAVSFIYNKLGPV